MIKHRTMPKFIALAVCAIQFVQASSSTTSIPRPHGAFGVSMATMSLTDNTRLDPFASSAEKRSLVASLYFPAAPVEACKWELVPAYPKRTAAIFDAEVAFAGVPNGSFEKIDMEVCIPQTCSQAEDPWTKAPLVFFTAGLGLSRLWYTALAQSVASFGFSVVTVDIPYDADVVEFPDGRIITAINSTWNEKQSELDVLVRAQDVSFVLDSLSNRGIVADLIAQTGCSLGNSSLAVKRVGIFGHSIGGAAAALAMFTDRRFVGSVNLDGGLYGPVIERGLTDPFMLFGHESNDTSSTWIDIWPNLTWKLDIEILNSTHTTFTDIPLLAEMIFGSPLPTFVRGIVGRIPGERARDVITTYVVAFMRMVLKCDMPSLLQRPSKQYPEIIFRSSPAIH